MKIYIFLIILLSILTGCRSEVSNKENVMFLHYFTGSFSQGIDELSEVINKKQKNINLVTTPLEHEEFKVSIRIQLETKNPPDLFSYWAGARTQYLVERDKVSPINDLFNAGLNASDFDESVLNACSYNNKIYMLPLTRHFVGFFYNKRLFDEFNLTTPRNWDELLVIAETFQKNNIVPFALGAQNRWPAQFWFDYLLLRTAGYEYRQKLMNKKTEYTDDEVINVMEIWKNLIDKSYFNWDYNLLKWDDAAETLVKNESAMTLMGTWAIPYMKQQEMTPDVDYGFFPFPQMNNTIKDVSLGPIDGILLSKGSKNHELSKEILYYLAQPETQQTFNISSGAIAPHREVKDDKYSPIQLQIKKLIQKSAYWAFNYDLATEPSTSETGLDFFMKFMESSENYKSLLNDLQNEVSQN